MKRIGYVELDYKYYDSKDQYSDGEIEDVLLEAAQNKELDGLLKTSNDYAVLYHLSPIRENLLDWYPFKKNAKLLEIGAGCGALTGLFASRVKHVTCIELSERRSEINAYRNSEYSNIRIIVGNFENIEIKEKYDYITMIGVWEYAGSYVSGVDPYYSLIAQMKKYLKPDGKLLIAIENKMGLKYWNGAREDHTFKSFFGLNDYPGNSKVRTFSKDEIERILKDLGFTDFKFYYPNPDYKLPDTIYSDDRMPRPGEIRNYKQDYDAARFYCFSDAAVADQICYDNRFSYFSNSFLIECGNSECSNVIFAKYNRIRRSEYRTATIMYAEDDIVVRRKRLSKRKEDFPEGLQNECSEEKYTEGITLQEKMYQFRNDPDIFVDKAKNYLDIFLSSFKDKKNAFYITEEYKGFFGDNTVKNAECLENTNVDLIFSNLIINDNEDITNIDKEWTFAFPIPYEYPIWRAMNQLYSTYMYSLKYYFSRSEFLRRVGIKDENIRVYRKMENAFVNKVFGNQYLTNYIKNTATMSIEMK